MKSIISSKSLPLRIHYIDVMRGLLMLIVVLGHSIGDVTNPVNKFILSFHMPAFFILSGMCFKPKSPNFPTMQVLKRKSKGLAWPYFILSLVGVVLYWLLLAGTSKDLGVSVSQTIIGIIWNDEYVGKLVTMGFWFVYDLIWITILYIMTKHVNRFLCIFVSAILFLILYHGNVNFYFSSEIVRISIGFMLFTIGDIFSAYVQRMPSHMSEMVFGGGKFTCLLSVISLLFTFVISQNNASVLMYDNVYGNAVLFVSSSVFGAFGFYCMARVVDANKALEYIGRNTLSILLFHFYVLMVLHVLLHKLFPEVNNFVFPYNALHFVVAVFVCCALAWGIKRFFPWMLKWPSKV